MLLPPSVESSAFCRPSLPLQFDVHLFCVCDLSDVVTAVVLLTSSALTRYTLPITAIMLSRDAVLLSYFIVILIVYMCGVSSSCVV